jgi:hypothetical protein
MEENRWATVASMEVSYEKRKRRQLATVSGSGR